MSNLDLALIGNGTIGLLIDSQGTLVWGSFPRFDSDPTFCRLLQDQQRREEHGYFAIEMVDLDRVEQEYLENTAILVTWLFDKHGGGVEIIDCAPCYRQYDRVYAPTMVVRQIRPLSGTPRIRVRLRPAHDQGAHRASTTSGSNHVRYLCGDQVLRLTSAAPVVSILEETPFVVDGMVTLVLGPDETLEAPLIEFGRQQIDRTTAWWREWVRSLAVPFEWQEEVIRAAITLKLNTCEDTGAVIAAMTTSIPESADSGRNWDYRYCWLRDAYFVINALNRLGATRSMERYLRYIVNLVAAAPESTLRPVYAINGGQVPDETTAPSLGGYRGMGPVRLGNQARDQIQHDVYGSAILAVSHVFVDRRLTRRGDQQLFHRLEQLGDQAATLWDKPDAGIWELRGKERQHTFSAVMCWAACDRLARIAEHLAIADRAAWWRERANQIREQVLEQAWNPGRNSFVSTLNGDSLDASLLHMHTVGFISPHDPRFISTLHAIETTLRRGDFLLRYDEQDDFGYMENAFLVCTFWYIDALAATGRRDEARDLFQKVLRYRNTHGLFSEDVDPRTGEQWGNFVQTYSMVGVINSALRLSIPWADAI